MATNFACDHPATVKHIQDVHESASSMDMVDTTADQPSSDSLFDQSVPSSGGDDSDSDVSHGCVRLEPHAEVQQEGADVSSGNKKNARRSANGRGD